MALNVEFDGRSRRVRVTPATTMLQVAEDARAQFGLPAGAFQLLHRRRALDPALPFRLSGVPNNAALELQPLAAGGQQVRVCVQQADGKRVQAAVAADATLASMLEGFQLLPARDEFALSFLQQEIAADAFASTTLQDLGIVSGSAIFRVQPAQNKTALGPSQAAAVQQPPPPPPVVAPSTTSNPNVATPPAPQSSVHALSEPTAAAQRLKAPVPTAPTVFAPPVAVDADEEMKEGAEFDSETEEKASRRTPALSSYDSLQLLRDSCFDASARGAVTTLMKIVTNLLSYPDNEKMRSIRVSNAAFQRSVGQLRGGVEFLQSIGFVLDQDTMCLVLKSAVDARAELEEGLRLLHNEADDLNIEEAARPQVVVPRAADPTFDVYKSQIHRMQAQPRGPSVTEVLVDNLKSKQEQLIGHEVPPRNTVITLPGRLVAAAPSVDISGDVAVDEEHPSDSQILISTLKAKRAEAEKTKNFRTQAMRELDELKKKKVFQTTLIRVQFPDRVMLQAAFHPNETVQAVIEHVKESLQSALSTVHSFYLYVTPPMQKLDPTKTLAELNLVPAALAYLSWIDAAPVSEIPVAGFYLRDDLVADELAESKESEESTAKVAYPKPIALEPPPATADKSGSGDGAAPKSSASSTSSGAAANGKKKPAWLKLR